MARRYWSPILVLFVSLCCWSAHGADSYVKGQAVTSGAAMNSSPGKSILTDSEKAFLQKIPQQAVIIIKNNIKNTQYQLDCMGDEKCEDKKQITEAIQKAYLQYRTYYVLGHMSHYYHPRATQMNRDFFSNNLTVSTPYSKQSMTLVPEVQNTLLHTYRADRQMEAQKEQSCGDLKLTLSDFYQQKLSQIITLAPVVLLIKSNQNIPSEESILEAYKDLHGNYKKSLEKFEQLKIKSSDEDLMGLFGYQMLAQLVVKSNPTEYQSTYEALTEKLTTQTIFGYVTKFIKENIFSLNALFIGCAAFAIVTANPIVGLACAFAQTAKSVVEITEDNHKSVENLDEWVAGVRRFSDVEAGRLKIKVDWVLLGINMWGTSIFGKKVLAEGVGSSLRGIATAPDKDVLRENVYEYTKELFKDRAKDHGREGAVSLSFIFGAQLVGSDDLGIIAQAATEILAQYRQVGYYSYSATIQNICPQIARRQLENAGGR